MPDLSWNLYQNEMLSCRQCTKLAAVCFTAYRIEPCIFPACILEFLFVQFPISSLRVTLLPCIFQQYTILFHCGLLHAVLHPQQNKAPLSAHTQQPLVCWARSRDCGWGNNKYCGCESFFLWTLYIYTQTYLNDVHLVVHHPCFSVLIFIFGIKATLSFSSSGIRDFS